MAKPSQSSIVPPSNVDPDGLGDDLTDEEIEQASVGDLITIQGAEFDNVSWSIWRHRTRQEMAAEHSGEAAEWVADRTGQLHGTDLVEAIGGGTFNMRGYVPRSDGRGVRLKYNRTIALAGPRKNFSAVAPAIAPVPVANGSLTRAERILLRALKKMDERLEKIEKTPSSTNDNHPPTLKEMAETLLTLKGLTGSEKVQRDPDVEIVKTYVGMIQQGIELGQAREPLPAGETVMGGPDWGKIAETAMTLLERLMSRAAAQRAAQRGVRPPSQATVVEDPNVVTRPSGTFDGFTPSADPVGEPSMTPRESDSHRWMTAVEAMANAVAGGDDPLDFSITLERILDAQELALLKFATVDRVLEKLQPHIPSLPVLATPEAKTFLTAVLAELKNPSNDAA